MKKTNLFIILCLLFLSNGYSQIDSTKVSKIQQAYDPWIPYATPIGLTNNDISIDINKHLIKLYDEYVAECYADSTLQHTHSPEWNDKCFRETGNLAIGYGFILDCKDSSHYSYVHRSFTFEGFIEFVRSRTIVFLRNRIKGE